jgi:tellurite resistance protein TerA
MLLTEGKVTMGQLLQPGGNLSIVSFSGTVIVTHDIDSNHGINLTAFLLTNDGKVQGDNGIVYYNQPNALSGVTTFISPIESGSIKTHQIDFNLRKTPVGITKIAVTLTDDNNRSFLSVRNLRAEVRTEEGVVHLNPGTFTTENSIIVLELYVRNEQPKVKAVWQGFTSGFHGICKYYGVDVEDNPAPISPVPTPASIPTLLSQSKSSTIDLQNVSSKIQLSKGSKPVMIEKSIEISASISWRTGTDYDVYALIYTQDGRQIDVATFGAKNTPALLNFDHGTVEHMGDIGGSGNLTKTEIIKIRLNDKIMAVVPVAYSAQSNGTGSFNRYKVSMSIDNHNGTVVTVTSNNADENDEIYTCVLGMILNTPDGVVIKFLELYSKPGSENRPKLVKEKDGHIEVIMDEGPINDYM